MSDSLTEHPTLTSTEIRLESSWKELLKGEFEQDYFKSLREFLKLEKSAGYTIYPPGPRIFAAFDETPVEKVKAVIIGQDPYHGDGQANGLCFSVAEGIRKPPSLLNIFKELERDLALPIPVNGNLDKWALQGVLLLNATLTVRANTAGSHQNRGWEQFTDAAIRKLSDHSSGLVFLLWGRFAQAKAALIDRNKHFILEAAHPSPLARTGFAGCRHFSKTNEILKSLGKEEIDWRL
ncbi:MAG: uracil-DNA glycosylase [Bacteroidetes bacterium]|nr:uracil-DNA glycosylase [Bacteroidota bacterium]